MQRTGYTLIEISVVSALLTGIFLITSVIMTRSVASWQTEEAYAMVSAALRETSFTIRQELEDAVYEELKGAVAIDGLQVDASGTSLTFRKPLAPEGDSWSAPIILRLRNEDGNGNLILDSGEDEDGNGNLDRVVERLVDLNGDGKRDAPGEWRIIGRNVEQLNFVKDDVSHSVRVYVRSRVPLFPGSERIFSDEHRMTVYVRN